MPVPWGLNDITGRIFQGLGDLYDKIPYDIRKNLDDMQMAVPDLKMLGEVGSLAAIPATMFRSDKVRQKMFNALKMLTNESNTGVLGARVPTAKHGGAATKYFSAPTKDALNMWSEMMSDYGKTPKPAELFDIPVTNYIHTMLPDKADIVRNTVLEQVLGSQGAGLEEILYDTARKNLFNVGMANVPKRYRGLMSDSIKESIKKSPEADVGMTGSMIGTSKLLEVFLQKMLNSEGIDTVLATGPRGEASQLVRYGTNPWSKLKNISPSDLP
jgi:hypothetical protein